MTWFKVDDSIYDHPKFDNVGLDAVGLWMLAGAYCARHLTDGLIGHRAIVRLGGNESVAQELVNAGLWVTDDDGYRFHDWRDHQPSRDEIQGRRKASAERVRQYRERMRLEAEARANGADVTPNTGNGNGVGNGVTNGVSNAPCNATPDPTRPDPSRPVPSEEHMSQPSRDDDPSPEVVHLISTLSESLTRLGVKHKPTAEWARTIRLMIERDHRTPVEIEAAIRWAHSSDFWVGVILSPKSLRKNFEQMRIQANRPSSAKQRPPTAADKVTALQERIQARARAGIA